MKKNQRSGGSMENRRRFRWGTHMGGQARHSLYRHRLGLGARQICLKIKLISRLGARPFLSLHPSFFASILLPFHSLSSYISLSLSLFLSFPFLLSLSLFLLLSSFSPGISGLRGHEQIEGTGPRWRRRRRWTGGPPCHRHGPRGEKRRWRSNKELWTSGCGHCRAVVILHCEI